MIKHVRLKGITVFFFILLIGAGCNLLQEEETLKGLPSIPRECRKQSNLYTKTLDGMYRLAQVSQFQVGRAATRLHECLINSGITDAEARGIIKKKDETIKKKIEKEGIKSSDDFFVF
ncbi:MAG: hypothetical protein ACXACY_28880 [Candidatus Hodarchaeales archaeon]|jgi:hypothetical protein